MNKAPQLNAFWRDHYRADPPADHSLEAECFSFLSPHPSLLCPKTQSAGFQQREHVLRSQAIGIAWQQFLPGLKPQSPGFPATSCSSPQPAKQALASSGHSPIISVPPVTHQEEQPQLRKWAAGSFVHHCKPKYLAWWWVLSRCKINSY